MDPPRKHQAQTQRQQQQRSTTTNAKPTTASSRLAALSLDPTKIAHLGLARTASGSSDVEHGHSSDVGWSGLRAAGASVMQGGSDEDDVEDDDAELDRRIDVFRRATTPIGPNPASTAPATPAFKDAQSHFERDDEDEYGYDHGHDTSSPVGSSGIRLITVTEPVPSFSTSPDTTHSNLLPTTPNLHPQKPRKSSFGSGPSNVLDVRITGWEMIGGRPNTHGRNRVVGRDEKVGAVGVNYEGDAAGESGANGTKEETPQRSMDKAQMGAYIVYKIDILLPHGARLHKVMRYTDFETLRRAIKRGFPDHHAAIMSLPSKNHLRKFDPAFLDNRQARLQYWLKSILLHPVFGPSPLIRAWLTAAKGG